MKPEPSWSSGRLSCSVLLGWNHQDHQGDDHQDHQHRNHHQGDDQHLPGSAAPSGPSGWWLIAGTMRIETPGICHQSFRMPPRIDDLGLGELPVDSGWDRALAGLLCTGNGVRSKPCESGRCWSMVLARGQDAGVLPTIHRQGIVRGSSGDRLVLLRGSSRWMGACSPISGVIVSPTGIYWLRIGSINSLPLVLVLVVVGWWMRHRYAPPICIADMVRRYGATICKAWKQKRPRAYCSWPLMLWFVILLLLFDPLDYLPHISGDDSGNEVLKLD